MNGATGYDGSGSTAYTNLFAPPSPLTQPIDFNTFLASFSDIASAARQTRSGRWDLPRLELRRRGG